MKLDGKKILLIAPSYFGYENAIKETLERDGAIVTFIKENLDYNSKFNKLVGYFSKKIADEIRVKQFMQELKICEQEKFHIIFGIRLNCFNQVLMEYIKEHQPEARILLYFWDSARNMKDPFTVADYADEVFSFDRKDCLNYGWKHRPLFYLKEYSNIKECSKKDTEINTLFCIASLSEERARLAMRIKELITSRNVKLDLNFYMPAYLYWKRKLFNKEYKDYSFDNVLTQPMLNNEILDRIKECDVVLDICHSSQTGLTMRTIETLGAGKRLITNNKDIIHYDFYNKNNVFVLEEINEDLINFIENGEYEEISTEIYQRYSLEEWINEVLSI